MKEEIKYCKGIRCPGLIKAGAIAHPGKLVREDIANSEDRAMAMVGAVAHRLMPRFMERHHLVFPPPILPLEG